MDAATEQIIRSRAHHRCEYCHLPEQYSKLQFHVEHIIARQHGGDDSINNLALACGFCNRHKGPNIAGIDELSKQVTPLFNPRQDQWHEHFRLSDAVIEAISGIGRVTISVLAMNHPQQTAVRQALVDEGVFDVG